MHPDAAATPEAESRRGRVLRIVGTQPDGVMGVLVATEQPDGEWLVELDSPGRDAVWRSGEFELADLLVTGGLDVFRGTSRYTESVSESDGETIVRLRRGSVEIGRDTLAGFVPTARRGAFAEAPLILLLTGASDDEWSEWLRASEHGS